MADPTEQGSKLFPERLTFKDKLQMYLVLSISFTVIIVVLFVTGLYFGILMESFPRSSENYAAYGTICWMSMVGALCPTLVLIHLLSPDPPPPTPEEYELLKSFFPGVKQE